jgi:hypothetical protein
MKKISDLIKVFRQLVLGRIHMILLAHKVLPVGAVYRVGLEG